MYSRFHHKTGNEHNTTDTYKGDNTKISTHNNHTLTGRDSKQVTHKDMAHLIRGLTHITYVSMGEIVCVGKHPCLIDRV